MTLLRKIFKRNHVFDLEKPVTRMQGGFAITGYQCKRCGCVLYYERGSFSNLPASKRFC